MKKVLLLLLVLFLLSPLFAENFYIEQYNVNLNIQEDGTYEVDEILNVVFTQPSHGIYRDIQTSFRNIDGNIWDERSAEVSNVVATELSSILESDEFISLRLGDPRTVIKDNKTYFIHYRYKLDADKTSKFDEFYYNIVSSAWDCPILTVNWSVTFPKPIERSRISVTTGSYGDTERSSYTLLEDNMTLLGRETNLNPLEALTVRVELEEGYFNYPKRLSDKLYTLLAYLPVLLGIMLLTYIILSWMKYGKDDQLIVTPEFNPPERFTPMDVSYVLDGKIEVDRDLAAMLFYWADMGLISITEEKKDDFIFTKLNEIPETEKKADKLIFNAMFSSSNTVSTSMLGKERFAYYVENRALPAERSYFKKNNALKDEKSNNKKVSDIAFTFIFIIVSSVLSSLRYFGALTVFLLFTEIVVFLLGLVVSRNIERSYKISRANYTVSVVLLTLLFVIPTTLLVLFGILNRVIALSPLWIMLNIGILLTSALFSSLTEKRSDYGKSVLEGILGFRDFIEYAEIDQLKALIDEDPSYYYKTLSYAIALNLENEWAKKFKNIFISPPSWYYSASLDLVDVYYLTRFSRRFSHSYQSVIRPQSFPRSTTSGGSHFGGGGFSGGGFSGGGGRSW